MKIPIHSGIYVDDSADYRIQYPVNMLPVITNTGIGEGFIKPMPGIATLSNTDNIDKGGIVWKGNHYRVIGNSLHVVYDDGLTQLIGILNGASYADYAKLDYSFDRLAIAYGNNLYYVGGFSLTQVTDPDLGAVKDMLWVDGYFMTTDGEYLIVTELNDPFAVNPFKYGSSESDPDPILKLLKLHNEVHVLNRNSIEVFQNAGTEYFPFQRVAGAQYDRGVVGTRAATTFMENIVFVGGGRNESVAVWLGRSGSFLRISTREIGIKLREYSDTEIANIHLETIVVDNEDLLLIHLPDQTLVYNGTSSQMTKMHVWSILRSGPAFPGRYLGRNFVLANGVWICGHPQDKLLGFLNYDIFEHYGNSTQWIFSTNIIYSNNKGVIIHDLELLGISGLAPFNVTPTAWTSYSLDGVTWSQEKLIYLGVQGDNVKRISWRRQGFMRNKRIQKFRGNTRFTVAALEATMEPLYV